VTRPRDRGFALLIVLWSLVLVSLILSQVLASGRSATALAQTGRETAMGRAAADGAIAAAVFHLLNHDSGWSADGATQVLTIGASAVTVEVRNLAARINPNLASTALLAGLFQAAGLATQQSTTLARAVTAWRSPPATGAEAAARVADYRRVGMPFAPPGRSFKDIAELGHVIGMTPAVLAAITPVLSLDQSGDPDPAIAPPMVREALKRAGQTGAHSGQFDGNFPVVAIEADARGPGRSLVRREAVVSLPGDQAKTPYRILALTDAQ
jgi:general secretion pathway protein K